MKDVNLAGNAMKKAAKTVGVREKNKSKLQMAVAVE